MSIQISAAAASVVREGGEITISIPLTNVGDQVAYNLVLYQFYLGWVLTPTSPPPGGDIYFEQAHPYQVNPIALRFDASQLSVNETYYLYLAGYYYDPDLQDYVGFELGVDVWIPEYIDGPSAPAEAVSTEITVPDSEEPFIDAQLVLVRAEGDEWEWELRNNSFTEVIAAHLELQLGGLPYSAERLPEGWHVEHADHEGITWVIDGPSLALAAHTGTKSGFFLRIHFPGDGWAIGIGSSKYSVAGYPNGGNVDTVTAPVVG